MAVDLGKVQKEAGFLRSALRRLGLPTDFRRCIGVLAGTIRDHKHLESVLSEAEPGFRQEFYDALRPHLRFTPKPLDAYVAAAGQRAEREQLPVVGEDGKLREFRPAADIVSVHKDAQDAIARALAERTLTLTCAKCLAEEQFHGVARETNVDVILKARAKGWVYDPETQTETCPKCPAPRSVVN